MSLHLNQVAQFQGKLNQSSRAATNNYTALSMNLSLFFNESINYKVCEMSENSAKCHYDF